tara:strand:- start:139 stop:1251 length:1113 start_codon:yes stop_codon:yes gene_type:complete
MVDLRLVKAIQSALSKGENINQIRKNLFNKGFSPNKIEESINYLHNFQSTPQPKKTISKKKIIIWSIIFLLLITGVILIFNLFNEKEDSIISTIDLDININEISERLTEGDKLDFKYGLVNPTSYSSDVELKQEIQDSSGKIISSLSSDETLSSNFDRSKFGEIDTSELPPGEYYLVITLFFDSITRKTEKKFKILGDYQDFQNNTNQSINNTEEYIPPAECESHTDCDDENICTTNSCENNKCEIQQVTPCCGNGVCESSESSSICSEDCQETETLSELSDAEITNLAIDEASTNSGLASQYCASIEHEGNKDSCFVRIAYISENSALCSQVIETDSRDDCYLSLANIDSTVCQEIINPIKKVACEAVQ